MNRKKQSSVELILLGLGYVIVFYGALFYRYTTIVGICITLVGCYLWTRRKNRSWAFMLWGILGPLGFLGIALLKDKTVTNLNISAGAHGHKYVDVNIHS